MSRPVKAVAALAAFFLAAVAVMFLMGSALPQDHTASAAITIHASQGKVWSIMEDVEAQPRWRSSLKAVKPLPNDLNGHRCWLEEQRTMRLPLCEEFTDAPITRIVAIADPTLGFSGTWTYNLTSLTPDTTVVTLLEQGSVRSPFWRFAGHYLTHEDATIRRYETDLDRATTR